MGKPSGDVISRDDISIKSFPVKCICIQSQLISQIKIITVKKKRAPTGTR